MMKYRKTGKFKLGFDFTPECALRGVWLGSV